MGFSWGAQRMTQAFSAAVATAAKLPPEEQDALASILLEEIGSEERWSTLLAQSQDKLSQLAAQALNDFEEGRTQPLEMLE